MIKTAIVFQKKNAQKNRMRENAPKTNIGLNAMVVLKIIVKPEYFVINAWRKGANGRVHGGIAVGEKIVGICHQHSLSPIWRQFGDYKCSSPALMKSNLTSYVG